MPKLEESAQTMWSVDVTPEMKQSVLEEGQVMFRVGDAEEQYTLGSTTNSKGKRFYQNKDGNIDLVKIPDEIFDVIGIQPKPFRITEDMVGHVYDRHKNEIGASTKEEVVNFIVDIMKNFDHVREGNTPNSFVFSIENNRNKSGKRAITIIIDSNNDNYIGIKTSGLERLEGLKKRKELWASSVNINLAADATTANVATNYTNKSGDINGNASNQNSFGKATTNNSKDKKLSIISTFLHQLQGL